MRTTEARLRSCYLIMRNQILKVCLLYSDDWKRFQERLRRAMGTVKEGDRVAQLVLERVRLLHFLDFGHADCETDLYPRDTGCRGAGRKRTRSWRLWKHRLERSGNPVNLSRV